MELVGIIAVGIVLVVGIVLLWRSTPPKPEHPEPSEDDGKPKEKIVDVMPGGFGGPGGGS